MKIIVFIIIIFVLILFIFSSLPDDIEEIDNSDGQIICANTNEPCIKDKLYTKCNNCNDCPYENY